MKKLQRVLIMAGGTGGHVFPGLAIAKKLQEKGIAVEWLGTHKGLEARLVPEANIPLHFINISGIRGKNLKSILVAPLKIAYAIFQSIKIFRTFKPDIIIGMGGFVSGPGGLASFILRIPLVIHEQNARAGTTNKWLAKIAKIVLQGFPNTLKNAETVGNPVRAEIESANANQQSQARKLPLQILILGGSMGARDINQILPRVIAKLPADQRPIVYHQTGQAHVDDTLSAYQALEVSATIVPFIANMAEAYSWADIVICRSGALTVAELCVAGKGAILVPFPHATDDHQTANAQFMVQGHAAFLIPQHELEAQLPNLLKDLTLKTCQALANSAYKLRNLNAADKVLTLCEEISL